MCTNVVPSSGIPWHPLRVDLIGARRSMPSPVRRSARGAPPPSSGKPSASVSSTSTSTLSSVRVGKTHEKSSTPHSRSSEETSEPPRRSQRAHHPPPKEMESGAALVPAVENGVGNDEDEDEDEDDEEDITRCVCGHQEYPGPPLSEAFRSGAAQGEDAGGLFIQCDGCSVWQHGGCVGIIEESQSPDKYYCEECKPREHKLHTDSRGQSYSLYVPVTSKRDRKASVSKVEEKAKKDRDVLLSRASADPTSAGRRRATMRSKEHDAEEEQLRRALEESKREVEGTASNGRRNGKRGRDDSDDNKHENHNKRPRRASESITSLSRTATVDGDGSEDELPASKTTKRGRPDAAQSARQAEQREKARAEAAGRRQERAGRRRGEELDPAEDTTPKPSVSAKTSPPASSLPPSPPPPPNDRGPSSKKAAGPGKRTMAKKLGNNQYTKQAHTTSPPPGNKKRGGSGGTTNSSSGDEQQQFNGDGTANNSTGTGKNSPVRQDSAGGKGGRTGKGAKKSAAAVERSLANMKRAMESMAAFVQRVQADAGVGVDGSIGNGDGGGGVGDAGLALEQTSEGMSSLELAGVVARNIEVWNRRFGHLVV